MRLYITDPKLIRIVTTIMTDNNTSMENSFDNYTSKDNETGSEYSYSWLESGKSFFTDLWNRANDRIWYDPPFGSYKRRYSEAEYEIKRTKAYNEASKKLMTKIRSLQTDNPGFRSENLNISELIQRIGLNLVNVILSPSKKLKFSSQNHWVKIVFACFVVLTFISLIFFIWQLIWACIRLAKRDSDLMKEKDEKDFQEVDDIEMRKIQESTSNRWWSKQIGNVADFLKVSRGGAIVSLSEINIFTLSEFDEKEILDSLYPIFLVTKLDELQRELKEFTIISDSKIHQLTPKLVLKSIVLKPISGCKKVRATFETLSSLLGWISLSVVLTSLAVSPIDPISLSTPVSTEIVRVTSNGLEVQEFYQPIQQQTEEQIVQELQETEKAIENEVITKESSKRQKSMKRRKRKKQFNTLADLPPIPYESNNIDEEEFLTPNTKIQPIKVRIF